ncbi:MAG: DUF2934 domain-containing protein [Alphaproteobacteria bacterium]|nr:DUF2934 domain-containing protein [Alphaproteobacteria bacterium]
MAQNMQDRIRETAYLMWEQDGRQEGREMDYWLAAEQSVVGGKTKTTRKKAVAAVSSAPRKRASSKKIS